METKNFYSSKGIIKNMKRKVTGWEKIFTIHIFDKELVSRIHKQVIPPIIKKNVNGNRLNHIFYRKDTQIATKLYEKML